MGDYRQMHSLTVTESTCIENFLDSLSESITLSECTCIVVGDISENFSFIVRCSSGLSLGYNSGHLASGHT